MTELTALYVGDCLNFMANVPDDTFDLTVTSPPYEDVRTYDIGFKLTGDDWVKWSVDRFVECVRVTKGLVAWVVEGKTRQFQWSATPVLLMAELHRRGVKLRKPPVFHRVGIPGSGGPDWWRNDYELIVCASKGKLPWSDNTACGKPPKWQPGGSPSHRMKNGRRVDKKHTKRGREGIQEQGYTAPKLANPGNVIRCKVGGGRMGSKLAHENEAPFPESLIEPFVRCFCPPGGIVFDPFCGSGTSGAVAVKHERQFVGCDIRDSQVGLTQQRLTEAVQ